MGLFNAAQIAQLDQIAAKSKEILNPPKTGVKKSINAELESASRAVVEYFKDSPAILITTVEDLHEYINKCIEAGYVGIDTETTGLDRIHDTIVGCSLYYPGGVECYVPSRHLAPIFEEPYKNQLTYEEVGAELQRLVIHNVKAIFANADFDISMMYKDYKVDFIPICYYDVILAWRCLKENEIDNALKVLYNKYVLKGKGDPKKFSDFFNPKIFPYCKPEIAKLYAANDAKITVDLCWWQLPYVTKTHSKCKKHHLEKVADLVWNIEFPMIKVCAMMHRVGSFLDKDTASVLHNKYISQKDEETAKLASMIQEVIDQKDFATNSKRPFRTGKDFNPNSTPHVKYLCENLLGMASGKGTGKEVLNEINLPSTNQILKVRGLVKLMGTYVDKLPKVTTDDSRIHAQFKSVGAATGRMCIAAGTKISCLNGDKLIENIVPGDLVYCYDDNGTLQLKPVKNLWKTGENRDCVRIKWQSNTQCDSGELICTPEHPILRESGEWIRADGLTRNTKVAHLRRTVPEGPGSTPQLHGWKGLFTSEQDVVKYSIFHADSGMMIRHRDGNRLNNDLSNLEVTAVGRHQLSGTSNAALTQASLYLAVQSVEPAGKYTVYDIEVEDIHNFIANEICVHNSSADPRQYAYWGRKIKLTQGRGATLSIAS